MKKTLFLVLMLAAGGAFAAGEASELERSRAALLAEITGQAGASGSGAEGRLIAALAGPGAKSAARPAGADLKLIDSIWALGEIGGPDAERALLAALPSAGPAERVNIIAAVDKIDARAGRPAAVKESLRDAAGHFESGDILFRKGYFGLLNPAIGAQPVGHVGVFVGMENDEAMVIEGWVPVRKVTLKQFVHDWPFYGNYTTPQRPTALQRADIVRYVYAQLGKKYDFAHTVQKGPEKFDCVGLAEAAYESAGLNPTPDEFETGAGWPLTPTEQYEHTVPNF